MELVSKIIIHEGLHFEESLQGTIHIPTFALNKESGPTIWGMYKVTEIGLETFIKYHRNFWYILFDIRLLGFGITIQCRRRKLK
jgi:hypothetical protein